MERPALNLNDVGTREQHYIELIELFENSLELLKDQQHRFKSERLEMIADELDVTIEYLKRTVTGALEGFNVLFYRREINRASAELSVERTIREAKRTVRPRKTTKKVE